MPEFSHEQLDDVSRKEGRFQYLKQIETSIISERVPTAQLPLEPIGFSRMGAGRLGRCANARM
jgi:hypothetical protein